MLKCAEIAASEESGQSLQDAFWSRRRNNIYACLRVRL